MDIKKSAFKTKEEIDELIQETQEEAESQDEAEAASQDEGENQNEIAQTKETEGLVPNRFFTGSLIPNIEHYLPEDIKLTGKERRDVSLGVQKLSTGLRASMPIKCYGDKCPFKASCPLYKIGKAPVGKNCPIEAALLDTYTKRYLDEFEVEIEAMSEVTTMSMLAATHIMEMRAWIVLGKDDEGENPDGLIKSVVGFNADEQPIEQLQEHPAFNMIERAWRWRKNLLESLVGTRREKYRRDAAMGNKDNPANADSYANLKTAIDKLRVVDITPEKD